MFRTAAMVALAMAGLTTGAEAQRGWLVSVSGGYADGIGDTFEEGGSLSGSVSLYRPIAHGVDLGLDLGYHGLGTGTTRIPDLYGPGSTYREDFTYMAWQASAGVRLRPAATRIRPYIGAGAGAYLLRTRDVIEVRDAAGQPIPQYQFRQTNSDLYPGVNGGVGVDRLVSLGRVGLGVHARWHGIIAPGGVADFFTVSLGLALD
jgi:hypothetical protein